MLKSRIWAIHRTTSLERIGSPLIEPLVKMLQRGSARLGRFCGTGGGFATRGAIRRPAALGLKLVARMGCYEVEVVRRTVRPPRGSPVTRGRLAGPDRSPRASLTAVLRVDRGSLEQVSS